MSLDTPASLDELIEQLATLPGIGDWTANFIALRAAGQLDAFPAEDLGLRRAFKALDPSQGRQAGERDLLTRAEAWRPYRGVAAVCLWHSFANAQ
jgi:DNA-3-methyladenine glycosylase II